LSDVRIFFERGKARLLVDPATGRVVYLARDGILPERVMIVEGGRQHLFTTASCKVVDCAGPIPAGIHAQNCWLYRAGAQGLEPMEKTA
jgi:hypothetical protein